jgi:hypothetical protein
MITWGKGKYKVWIKQNNIGEDKIYFLGGGDKSHIGGIVICEPGKKINVIRLKNHYDYMILEIIAEKIFKKYNEKIIITGGVHIDNASKDEIEIIIENCRRLAECI